MWDVVLGMVLGALIVIFMWFRNGSSDTSNAAARQQRDFTVKNLARYNGRDGRLLYVAVKGEVFDVGASESGRGLYGPNGSLKACAGHDASRYLAVGPPAATASDIGRAADLDDLTGVQLQRLDACLDDFRSSYIKVGRLIRLRNFSLEELKRFDGKDGRPIYLAARGEVFDVTRGVDFYGPDGGYECMAGRDASRALARMSLDKVDVESRRIDNLSSGELDTLDEWLDKFHSKYTLVGHLTTPRPTGCYS